MFTVAHLHVNAEDRKENSVGDEIGWTRSHRSVSTTCDCFVKFTIIYLIDFVLHQPKADESSLQSLWRTGGWVSFWSIYVRRLQSKWHLILDSKLGFFQRFIFVRVFTSIYIQSFFGRSYNNPHNVGECKNNNVCLVNRKNRTSCKSCRLRKCLLVGMSKQGEWDSKFILKKY